MGSVGVDLDEKLKWVYEGGWEWPDDRFLDLLSMISLMLEYPGYGSGGERAQVIAAVRYITALDAQLRFQVERLELEQ